MTLHSTEERPVNMVMVAREEARGPDTVARRSVPLPYPSSMVVPISAGLNSKLASYPQSMARPSPSVSNRGLVIVQVQEGAHSYRLLPVQDTVLDGEEGGDRAVEARDLSNKLVNSSAHQLIHGYPPNTFLAEDEEEEEEEAEDEEEDTDFGAHDESDEGYRTNSSVASGSPLVETAVSPGPGVEEGSRPPPQEQMVTGRVTEQVEDEQGNLMWLVDFKLDFFNDIEREGGRERHAGGPIEEGPARKKKRLSLEQGLPSPVAAPQALLPLSSPLPPLPQSASPQLALSLTDKPSSPQHISPISLASPPASLQLAAPLSLVTVSSPPPPAQAPTSLAPASPIPSYQPQPLPVEQASLPSRTISSAKPNSTYTDLITLALKDKISLTVSGIYQWITENYPYFKAEDDRWKNSVRHNLSMNPHFRKGTKSKQGAGHVWVMADEGKGSYTMGLNQEPVKLISNDDEAAEAVRKILGSRPPAKEEPSKKRVRVRGGQHQSRDMQGKGRAGELQGRPGRPGELQRCAEEILAGHGRPTAVEGAVVQFLLPQDKHHESWRGPPQQPRALYPCTLPMNLTTPSPGRSLAPPPFLPEAAHQQAAYMDQLGGHEQVFPGHYIDCSYPGIEYSDPEGLEKALGLDFQGVVHRELAAK